VTTHESWVRGRQQLQDSCLQDSYEWAGCRFCYAAVICCRQQQNNTCGLSCALEYCCDTIVEAGGSTLCIAFRPQQQLAPIFANS
jgi:hypothetical protein